MKQLKIQNKIQLHKYRYKLTYKSKLLPPGIGDNKQSQKLS